jgi:peptidoglycan hydrolase FlgJ
MKVALNLAKPVASAAKPDPALRKAAEAFEAVMLRQMMASMRQAKLGKDVFGSSATDNFREMSDAKLADNMAGLRQFGIADMVERQLTKATPELPTSPVPEAVGNKGGALAAASAENKGAIR